MIGGKANPKAMGKAMFTNALIANLSVVTPAKVTGANGSFAIGDGAIASANGSFAIGSGAVANNGGISFGFTPVASGATSIAIGTSNATGSNSIAIGTSSAAGSACSTAIGYFATVDFIGETALSSMIIGAGGDIKGSFFNMVMQTTDGTVTELSTGGAPFNATPTSRIVLTNYSSYIFDVDIVCRQITSTTGVTAAWNIKFACYRDANAASVVVGAVTKTLLLNSAAGGVLSSADVTVTADTTNGRPAIKVTGSNTVTLRWVGWARMTKVASV